MNVECLKKTWVLGYLRRIKSQLNLFMIPKELKL